MAKRRAIYLGWSIAGALVVLVVLKYFVADVYPVRSSSMVPTIFGGDAARSGESFDEWVLVELNPPVDLVELPTIVRATGTLEVGERMGQGNAVECLYRMTGATLEAY